MIQEKDTAKTIGCRNSKYVNGVQFLVENIVTKVPDAYIQPLHKRPDLITTSLESSNQIPVIDLSGLQDHRRCQVIKEVRNASQRWGFFQVINHDVPVRVIEQMVDVSRRFHELPTHQKMLYYTTEHSLPFRFKTSFIAESQEVLDWRDNFLQTCYPAPADDQWLKNPRDFRDVAMEYGKEVRQLAKLLLAILSEGLNVSSDTLEKAFGHEFGLKCSINYYPPCPNPDLVLGVNAHSDPGGLTVLLQDEVGGLQVMNEGNWLDIKPLQNSFIINIADQVEVLSNGTYKSVEHRAILRNGNAARISIATFCSPTPETKVGPLTQLTTKTNPPLYKEFLFSDFLRHFFSKHYDGKSCLKDFKLSTEA